MKIYAYHEDLGDPRCTGLLKLWGEVWTDHGWSPQVLGLADAQKHPGYLNYEKACLAFPTVNHKGFEMSAFRRYLAFASLLDDEICAVADYDVFPIVFPWKPQDLPIGYCADPQGGPGFLVGNRSYFQKLADVIESYLPQENDTVTLPGRKPQAHVSDMTILQRTQPYSVLGDSLVYYSYPNWETRPLIHFSVNYVPRATYLEFVRKFMENVTGRKYE